jgi:type IV pilus assembly protein PilN
VILINLLPHRALALKKRRDVFTASFALSVLLGGVISVLIFFWISSQISFQREQNQLLQDENRRLDDKIKNIAALESEISALQARQQAVEDLQADRNLPVHLLTELSRQLPDGVFVSNMRQESQSVVLQGQAQSNERVSELLRNLSKNTRWFGRPELIEIIAGSITLSPGDIRRVANFTLRVHLVRSSEMLKPVPAPVASAPSPDKP